MRFVVLGHVRGDETGLNPRLAEVLDRVRSLHPAFLVLTGDIIWGDVNQPHADSLGVERQWDAIDSAVATVGVPVYRVPGNHDINDVTTRNIWSRRYGALPRRVDTAGLRLLLVSSAWIPPDGDSRHHAYIRGVDLDSAQVGWLARQLPPADSSAGTTFVFMHHLLWWEPDDGPWWRDVHPLLARGGVAAVFSGDYGPLKFSTLERDGVRYYQSSIELPVALELLRNRISSRVLSAQFDNFIEVVAGSWGSRVRVHTVDEESSGAFTPARFRAVTAPEPDEPAWRRLWNLVGTPRRLGLLAVGSLALLGLGFLLGRRSRRV